MQRVSPSGAIQEIKQNYVGVVDVAVSYDAVTDTLGLRHVSTAGTGPNVTVRNTFGQVQGIFLIMRLCFDKREDSTCEVR